MDKSIEFADIGFAQIDYGRFHRTGIPEAVFCPGKTPVQAATIFSKLAKHHGFAIATKANLTYQRAIRRKIPQAVWHRQAEIVTLGGPIYPKNTKQYVAVVAAGTGDIPIAEEAKVTLEFFGIKVKSLYDVGVAGINRLLNHRRQIRAAAAVIAVAGMDGVCPIVTAAFSRRLVVGIPSNIGYGTGAGGVAALNSMLNSCVPGLAVVNIGNGFGAACAVIKALNHD